MQGHLISVAVLLALASPAVQSDEIYCGEPPTIQFATLEKQPSEQYSVGDTLTYTCQFGYTKRGKISTLECAISDSEQKAEWTQPRFSCTPQSCGDPGYINNGRSIGSLFTFPSSVKYECNNGYKLTGLSTRYCQANGMWSGKLPVCEEITCPNPQNPENGFVTYTTLHYGSELEYKCDKGFHLNTEEIVFCTSDGKWSNTNVQCIESVCDMPQQPEHGSLQITGSNNKILAGTLALFSCDDNRIVDGPTTSKCLENGEWTFPPPKCLEPCTIPYLSNGVIGNYVRERYHRRRNFKQVLRMNCDCTILGLQINSNRKMTCGNHSCIIGRIATVGNKVQDDEILLLRCSDGYEVLGTEKKEDGVSCKLGKWSHELQCEPASCRSGPPSAQNSQAVVLNPEHGGRVLYLCDEDFIKTENESVVCDFGIWKGKPPVCKNTRCFMDDLTFPGLMKGRKTFYRHGEVFEVECDSRYRIANPNRKDLRCEDGAWKGPLPPCVAASCKNPPPEIDHGQAEVRSTVHSSIVKYTCRDPYTLSGNSEVQCLFGVWTGEPPKCEDSRCFLKNLQNSAYVDVAATDSVTLSGNRLVVMCKEGYSPRFDRPVCLNGKWSGNYASPCKENDCEVPVLYHGDIKELKIGDYYWSWKKFRYEREMKYVKISAGTVLPYGSTVNLFCHEHFSFQGTRLRNQGITCFKGQWLPHPVCLRVGETYAPRTTTQKPYTTTLAEVTEQSKPVVTPTKVSENSPSTTREVTTEQTDETVTPTAEETQTSEVMPPVEECYCEYPINDENLIAHADEKRLKFHDKVKNDSVVVFRCKHVGFHRLDGAKSMKCEGCRSWHSSEFPTCSEPKRGSAVIISDKTLNVSIEGDLEAKKGQDVKLMCVAVESGLYPRWSIPSKNGVTIKRERMERDTYGDVLYISHLAIENVDFENEGKYGCAIENNSMNVVNLVINDPDMRCPKFPDVDGISVVYDMERRVKSRATFFCKDPSQKIDGNNSLICQRNGEWSAVFPQCVDIKCRELKGNDLLLISYTNERKIGSKATFHCFAPGKRSGESFAECLDNGTWSNQTPNCRTPPCALEDIFSALPENVVPDVDDMNKTVPYNTTIKLTCADEMIVEGEPVAKCNRKGEWMVENVQCSSGCPKLPTDPDSRLIISPHKEVYKLGDMVTFLCPPGMSVTTESQLIMCLKYGWSETVLPDCQ